MIFPGRGNNMPNHPSSPMQQKRPKLKMTLYQGCTLCLWQQWIWRWSSYECPLWSTIKMSYFILPFSHYKVFFNQTAHLGNGILTWTCLFCFSDMKISLWVNGEHLYLPSRCLTLSLPTSSDQTQQRGDNNFPTKSHEIKYVKSTIYWQWSLQPNRSHFLEVISAC